MCGEFATKFVKLGVPDFKDWLPTSLMQQTTVMCNQVDAKGRHITAPIDRKHMLEHCMETRVT